MAHPATSARTDSQRSDGGEEVWLTCLDGGEQEAQGGTSPTKFLTSSDRAPPSDFFLNDVCQECPFEQLAAATNSFNESTRLGAGAFGTVYRGTLEDGTEVAIKHLKHPKESGFRDEVQCLSKIRHPNIVKLLSFSRNPANKERYLLYELMSGDLVSKLKDRSFTYRQRIQVACDVSLGLSHLHGLTPEVFHRDIKSPNILLDSASNAKLADFGLCLMAAPGESTPNGTIGYADPQYLDGGILTESTEVYSFGIVLMELLTARCPCRLVDGYHVLTFAGIQHVDHLAAMVPTNQSQTSDQCPFFFSRDRVLALARIALPCIRPHGGLRPKFRSLVEALRGLAGQIGTEEVSVQGSVQGTFIPPAVVNQLFRSQQCTICFEPLVDRAQTITFCGHIFHMDCLASWRSTNARGTKCPACRADINGTPARTPAQPRGEITRGLDMRDVYGSYQVRLTSGLDMRAAYPPSVGGSPPANAHLLEMHHLSGVVPPPDPSQQMPTTGQMMNPSSEAHFFDMMGRRLAAHGYVGTYRYEGLVPPIAIAAPANHSDRTFPLLPGLYVNSAPPIATPALLPGTPTEGRPAPAAHAAPTTLHRTLQRPGQAQPMQEQPMEQRGQAQSMQEQPLEQRAAYPCGAPASMDFL